MTGAVLSRPTLEALDLFATLIRIGRIRRGWTTSELADRLGVTRKTVYRIEHAEPGVAVGIMFEAAKLVGVPLFGEDVTTRESFRAERRNELALLPDAIRAPASDSYDF